MSSYFSNFWQKNQGLSFEKPRFSYLNDIDPTGVLFGGEGGIRTGIYWILLCAGVSLQVPLSVAIPDFFEK